MFRRRSKDEQSAPTGTVVADRVGDRRDPEAPKGRPTPKRSEAQSQRRRQAAVPADRKAAARQAREARRADLAKQREALAGGDERYLPARDKGPVRKLARDYVDSRYHVAELFLPLAVVILVLSMFPNMTVKDVSLLMWLVLIILMVTQSLVSGLRLRKLLLSRFPKDAVRGAVVYGVLRTLQMRKLRLPKPQVKRGAQV